MSNSYTVGNLRQDLDSNLHAGGVSGLQDFYKTLDKGRRVVIGKVRPEELIRKSYIEQALYPFVDRYSCPEDLKYNDVIELSLLSGYRNVDTMNAPLEVVYRKQFGQKRGGATNVMNIGYENGVKYLRVFRPIVCNTYGANTSIPTAATVRIINNCDSMSLNGTWNVGGNVVNLHTDELNHMIGFASLAFDINNSSTTGYIENFTLDTFDLSTFLQKGAAFGWLDLPLPKEMLAVKLTLGSDSSNLSTDLYTSTINHPHDGSRFTTGWNLLKFMLNNLNIVGTPNPNALTYVRFDFTTTGQAIPNCHLDNIVARVGAVYEITYNGAYMFIDAITGEFKKIANSNSDIIVAEEDTYNLLLGETTLAAQKELYGSAFAAKSDVSDQSTVLDGLYKTFKREHKSEAVLQSEDEYIFGNIYDGYSNPGLPGSGSDIGNGGNNWWN
jgi:hypothetical protein